MIAATQVNDPLIVAEIRALFERYETALITNQVDVLDELFWSSGFTVRFGQNENLYGIDAIRAFRLARSSQGLKRSLANTVIATFGTDFATVSTEFQRPEHAQGRQSQSWVRFADGWKIVAAHISVLPSGSAL